MAVVKWFLVLQLCILAMGSKDGNLTIIRSPGKLIPLQFIQETLPGIKKVFPSLSKWRGRRGDSFTILQSNNSTTPGTFTRALSAGPECGNFVLQHGDEGIIHSDGGNRFIRCVSNIQSPSGTTMNIQCPHFDLASRGKGKERLIVKDLTTGIKKVGHKRRGPSMTTSSNLLQLQHLRRTLRKKESSGGFMCSISVGKPATIDGQCGKYTLAEDTYTVIYLDNDGKKRNCAYEIEGPVGTVIEMESLVFDLQEKGCKKEQLVFTESGKSQKYCAQDTFPVRKTFSSNSLRIHHVRKKLTKKETSGGFLCYFGASRALPSLQCNQSPSSRPFCEGCGCAQITVPRIVGGEEATPHEYPWMVLLDLNNGNLCGGALINTNWVLTAAHCFKLTGTTTTTVHLGAHYRHSLHASTKNEQIFTTSGIYNHPDYDEITQLNDIALVHLDSAAILNDRVNTICLANDGDVQTGDELLVTGWGVLEGGSIEPSDTLMEVQLEAIANSQCERLYQGRFTIYEEMICTLSPGRDACQGDSGGPLIKQLEDGRWVHVGIVSFGYGCAGDSSPGVYTNTAKYFDWIFSTIGDGAC